ncbi:MAG: CAP domain-containing protein [Acidimicrobiia bacterium]
MRKLGAVLVAASVALMVLMGLGAAVAGEDLTSLTNSDRVRNGQASLYTARELQAFAQNRAEEMARTGRLSHTEDLGRKISNWQRLGENVGRGRTLQEIERLYMGSPAHRENVLSADFTQIGVGVATSENMIYTAVIFRLPKEEAKEASAAPPPSSRPPARAQPVQRQAPAPRPASTTTRPTTRATPPTTAAPAPTTTAPPPPPPPPPAPPPPAPTTTVSPAASTTTAPVALTVVPVEKIPPVPEVTGILMAAPPWAPSPTEPMAKTTAGTSEETAVALPPIVLTRDVIPDSVAFVSASLLAGVWIGCFETLRRRRALRLAGGR